MDHAVSRPSESASPDVQSESAIMDKHARAVSQIATNIQKFYSRKEPFRIYHGSTNSTRKSPYQRERMIDTSALTNVLKFDMKKKTVLVEPNVPMDALVEATLKKGLLPPVVMEFPGITVGGGFAGTAGESSSFRHGFFDRTINSIEMVLADGEVVQASSTQKPDLFFGAASSFGTLGVTTLLEIQLIEAKSHVRLTYHRVSSIEEATSMIEKATNDLSYDYIDGIMFSKTYGVVCIGTLTSSITNLKTQRFTRRSDPWFYLHASALMKNRTEPITEAIPIVDYLFRYDRGGFWVAKYAFKYFITPFNRFTRYILDYFVHTRVMYHALHQSGLADEYIIQDVAIPYPKVKEFFEYLDTEFGHYPIWLCPLSTTAGTSQTKTQAQVQSPQIQTQPSTSPSLSSPSPSSPSPHPPSNPNSSLNIPLPSHILNLGIWGPFPSSTSSPFTPSPSPKAFRTWNRTFERKVHSLGGIKWLYAHTYYTRPEFDEIYNREYYERLREKYRASWLMSVFEKVRVIDDAVNSEKGGERREGGEIGGREGKEGWMQRGKRAGKELVWGVWPVRGLYGAAKAWRGGEYLLPKVSGSELQSKVWSEQEKV